MMSDADFTKRMLQTVGAVTAAAVLVAAVYAARDALMLVYISGLIAMGFAPLVRFLARSGGAHPTRGVPRVLAIFAIYIFVIGVFVLIALAVVPPLVSQSREFSVRVPVMFDDMQRFLVRNKLMTRRITLQEAVQNAPVGGGTSNPLPGYVGAISTVVGSVFSVITVLILSFYFLIEAESLFNYVMRFVAAPHRERVGVAAREAVRKVSAWLRAQLLLAGVMGVFAGVGLWMIGEPFFYVVALIAAIGETIPIVGPIIGGAAAVAVALTSSNQLAVTVGIYFLILHQLEANVFVPKIMERRVGVSPVAVIVALLMGGALWGLVGAILAIPTAAILAVIVDELAMSHPVVGVDT
jgi:predicted PurR-regulated permease PerM